MLSNVTNNFIEEAKELKNETMRLMFDSDMLNSMGAEEFMFMKRFMNLFDTSIEIVKEQAKMMDDMDRKLDLLLTKN